MFDICSKLAIKQRPQNDVTDVVLMSLLLIVKKFQIFFVVSMVDFELVIAVWVFWIYQSNLIHLMNLLYTHYNLA